MRRPVYAAAAAALTLIAAAPLAPAFAASQPAPQMGYPPQAVATTPSPVWSAPGEAPHYVLYGHYVGSGKWRQEWVLAP